MKKTILLITSVICTITLNAQNLNVELFDQYLRADVRYSGSWTYVAPDGSEYALLGAFSGLAAYSIDNSPVTEVGFVAGPGNNWREITVVGDHAYVTTEGTGAGEGMQVVSLEYLPDSLHLVTTVDDLFSRAHIIQSDIYHPDSAYVYVNGTNLIGGTTTTQTGIHIIDVSNPANPNQIGTYNPSYYIHDCHVRGNRLYAAALYQGMVDIVDISDKSNPQLLQQFSYPNAFTHSSWTSEDHRFLYVCDEVDGLLMRVFDIEDLNNISEIPQAQYTANIESLVHNPYRRGDFLFISHNTEGLRVLDIAQPDVPVEVGYYDTYTGPSGGYSGLWSACPFLPSGKIIGGDRTGGLFVWTFNDTKAGRIYGVVRDSLTGNELLFSDVTLVGSNDTINTGGSGNYAVGGLADMYSLRAFKPGYVPKTINNINLQPEDSLWVEIELLPITIDVNEVADQVIQVYPNPLTAQMVVDFSEASRSPDQILIFDVQGRSVLELNLDTGLNTYDLSGLENGLYFYEIYAGQERVKSGRFVKEE